MTQVIPFRQRAMDHAEAPPVSADVLRLSSAWTGPAYWALIAALAVSLIAACLLRVREYAAGPAVVRVARTVELTAHAASIVASVEVEPRARVEPGQVLIRFHAERERAELQRIVHELELQLARRLLDPTDGLARDALTRLSVEREVAASRLQELELRAPRAGIVGDLRVRPGQAVAPGDVLLTLSDRDTTCTVWTLTPGRYRPELRPGMELGFDVHGYRYPRARAVVERVGTEVIGPAEAARYLGSDIADAVPVSGPIVLVQARLPSCEFEVDREPFRFHHGMSGTAEIALRREPLLIALVPGLLSLWRSADVR